MLVLSRRKSETIVIDDRITITVCETGNGRVKIGVEAPREMRIVRGELVGARKVA